MSDQELASWNTTPMAFIQIEQDLISLTSEIQNIHDRAYITIYRRKLTKHQIWFNHPELVELRDLIRKAEQFERNKLKNKYIDKMRRIKMKNLELMPVNIIWNMVRKKDKPITIEINGKPCKEENAIPNNFADHILTEQNAQSAASEPLSCESSFGHYWRFKHVTTADVQIKVKSQKSKILWVLMK